MKTRHLVSLLAGLALSAGFAIRADAAAKKIENVSVVFQDPDHFTDVQDRFSSMPSAAFLSELHDYVQETASSRLPAGAKLTVTFVDIDLAGIVRPDKDNIRIMTGTTLPRAHIKFQLVGADNQVIKEGERRLSDMNYQQTVNLQNRNEPLGYDKQLLKDWITKEFKPGS